MALTDADRLQIVAMALMRHSRFTQIINETFQLAGIATLKNPMNLVATTWFEAIAEIGTVTACVDYDTYFI